MSETVESAQYLRVKTQMGIFWNQREASGVLLSKGHGVSMSERLRLHQLKFIPQKTGSHSEGRNMKCRFRNLTVESQGL